MCGTIPKRMIGIVFHIFRHVLWIKYRKAHHGDDFARFVVHDHRRAGFVLRVCALCEIGHNLGLKLAIHCELHIVAHTAFTLQKRKHAFGETGFKA